MGLAVMVELPLVVIDVQRAGPSTGMPTKTEQADLLQVMFGRNGDSPVPVVAPATPGRLLRHGHRGVAPRAQVHDPGRLPLRRVPGQRRGAVARSRTSTTCPTSRSRTGPIKRGLPPVRPRPGDAGPAVGRCPGTPGLEHRIGGLEKADITGNVSYDPDNHHRMQLLRQAKIAGIADDIPELDGLRPAARATC